MDEVHSFTHRSGGASLTLGGSSDQSETFQVDADSSNLRTIDLETNSTLIMQNGATLTNGGDLTSEGSNARFVGALDNEREIDTTSSLELSGTLVNEAQRLVDVSSTGVLTIDSVLTNDGIMEAHDASSIIINGSCSNQGAIRAFGGTIDINGPLANLAKGVLTGGDWAAYSGSAINIQSNGPVLELGANTSITLDDGDLYSSSRSGKLLAIEKRLTSIDQGADLSVYNRDYHVGTKGLSVYGSLVVYGTLSGGSIDGSGLCEAGGTISASIVGANESASSLTVMAEDNLNLTGNNDFSGSLQGYGNKNTFAAILAFSGGTDYFAAGATLTAKSVKFNGADLTLGENLNFANLLDMTSGQVDLGGHRLSLSGTTELSGGAVIGGGASSLRFASGSVTSDGNTTIASGVENDITDTIKAGTLAIDGDVTGTGSFQFAPDASAFLQFGGNVGSGQTIDFGGSANANLLLDRGSGFGGTVANFQGGDVIDLTHVADQDVAFWYQASQTDPSSGGTLNIMQGGQSVSSIAFAGNYSQEQFMLGHDNGSGTAISLVKPAAAT